MQIFCKKDNCITDIKEQINNVKGLLLKAIWLTNISLHQVFRVFCSFKLTFRSICPLFTLPRGKKFCIPWLRIVFHPL